MRGWRRKGAVIGAVLASMWILGCRGADDENRAAGVAAVVDSAGIPIVTSTQPVSEWTIGSEPAFRIGAATEGEPAYLFDHVWDVEVATDGRIWVTNQGDGTLRVFDPDGGHAFTVGGNGDGPFEFRAVRGGIQTGDRIFAYQGLRRPSAFFSLDGDRIELGLLAGVPTGVSASAEGVATVGGAGWAVVVEFPQGMSDSTGVFAETAPIYLLALDDSGQRIDLGDFPMWAAFKTPEMGAATNQEYGPSRLTHGCGDVVYTGWSSDWSVERYGADGRLERILRRTGEPPPVTDADREDFFDRMLTLPEGAVPPPGAMERRERWVRAMEFPERHKAMQRIVCGDGGELWVQRHDPKLRARSMVWPIPYEPTTWDVFDAEGVWAAVVELPANFWPTRMRRDVVIGIEADDFDIQYAVGWPLRRIPADPG